MCQIKCICGEFYCTTLFKTNLQLKHIDLVETYGDNALSDTTCRSWFQHCKNNDFKLEDKERSGAAKKFEDKELEEILSDASRIWKTLQVDESTVSKRLKVLGMIQKQGH